jgi:hypothetical protein
MKITIKKTDFNFAFAGHGHYNVTYISPKTGKHWSTVTTNMELIDATKNNDEPKKKDLNDLKNICKNN